MRPRRSRLGIGASGAQVSGQRSPSMRPRRSRLGIRTTPARCLVDTATFNEAEALAPRNTIELRISGVVSHTFNEAEALAPRNTSNCFTSLTILPRPSMRPRRSRLGIDIARYTIAAAESPSMRPRRSRLGIQEAQTLIKNAELPSMRPRRSRLGIMESKTMNTQTQTPSMRPRRSRLGIRYHAYAILRHDFLQ